MSAVPHSGHVEYLSLWLKPRQRIYYDHLILPESDAEKVKVEEGTRTKFSSVMLNYSWGCEISSWLSILWIFDSNWHHWLWHIFLNYYIWQTTKTLYYIKLFNSIIQRIRHIQQESVKKTRYHFRPLKGGGRIRPPIVNRLLSIWMRSSEINFRRIGEESCRHKNASKTDLKQRQ